MAYHRQQGVSLIELLVALTIFAIGILAIARLQFLSFRNMHQGMLRTVAIQQMANLLVRYRALHEGDAFNDAWQQWQAGLSPLLPQAHVDFAAQGPFCTVHLTWQPLVAMLDAEGMPITAVDRLDYTG